MTGRKCMQDALLELTLLDVTADRMMRVRKVESDKLLRQLLFVKLVMSFSEMKESEEDK